MKSHVRVAVIGGGVVGCSILYHLTKHGWKDVVLIERSELTSGSTWHAAGGMHTVNSDPNVARLQDYTIRLYKEIEEISGQSCGVHLTGGVMLACTPERLDYLKMAQARHRALGMESEMISISEAKKILPIMNEESFIGALYDPVEGHVDPSGVTNAYAIAARRQGAEIYRHTPVTDLKQRLDGGWDVITEKGNIHAEIVVNAGGLWAREVGRMVGLELPVLAMEHQYLVTDEMPEVIEFDGDEVAHAIDFDGEIYMRQEGRGMVIGTYEKAGVPWSPVQTPWDFGHELLQPDLDRISDNLEVAFEHFPPLANAGIKRTINGPFTFAPDGNPLIGPVRGLRNFHVACGVMAGFSQGGGVGMALANWICDGDPGMDVMAMDVARFGDYATMAYTSARVQENYGRRFSITYPNEQLPAGRPMRTTPVHDRLKQRNAVFGATFGLEQALWFAPEGAAPHEQPTFRRSNAFGPVGAECRAVRDSVGLIEISGFAKYDVSGPGAEAWISELLANRLPSAGRMLLSPMLNDRGRIIGDFTVARLAEDHFMIFGSGIAEECHMRWFEGHLPDRGVLLRNRCRDLTGLSVAGPQSRDLLSRLTHEDLSRDAFPFMSFRRLEIAGVPALMGRVTFTGDLGFEIWVEPDYQQRLFDLIMAEGGAENICLFGARALNSLRLEKSFGSFTREYTPNHTPLEAGMDRFVDFRKADFTGRDALLSQRDRGIEKRLVTLVVDADGADAISDEPVWDGGVVIGSVTSGGFAHGVGESLALAYLQTGWAVAGAEIAVQILGDKRPAKVTLAPRFDPDGTRMRG